jgi:uncharacterized phage protein gp47/JayE
MIPFKTREYQELFEELITYAQDHKIISTDTDFISLIKENKDIENFTVLLLSIMAKLYSEVYEDMSLVKDGYNILKAKGDDLDNIGAFKGIPRPEATCCSVDLEFTLDNPLPETLVINYPILVSTNDGIQYTTLSDPRTIEKNTTSFTMIGFATKTGVNQRVSQNTLNTLITTLPHEFGECKVTNPYPSTGGSDTATDTEYREYLLNSDKIHEKSTYWAYKNYLDRYNGLDSYNLVPQWDGTGTMKIIIDANDNTSYHINKITKGIQENVAWADDDITVTPATKIPVTVNLKCNVDIDQINPHSNSEKTEIASQLEKAILTYINGGKKTDNTPNKGLLIGEDFIPYQLGVFLASEVTSVKNITINNPNSPVPVKDDEIAYIESKDIYITME